MRTTTVKILCGWHASLKVLAISVLVLALFTECLVTNAAAVLSLSAPPPQSVQAGGKPFYVFAKPSGNFGGDEAAEALLSNAQTALTVNFQMDPLKVKLKVRVIDDDSGICRGFAPCDVVKVIKAEQSVYTVRIICPTTGEQNIPVEQPIGVLVARSIAGAINTHHHAKHL